MNIHIKELNLFYVFIWPTNNLGKPSTHFSLFFFTFHFSLFTKELPFDVFSRKYTILFGWLSSFRYRASKKKGHKNILILSKNDWGKKGIKDAYQAGQFSKLPNFNPFFGGTPCIHFLNKQLDSVREWLMIFQEVKQASLTLFSVILWHNQASMYITWYAHFCLT